MIYFTDTKKAIKVLEYLKREYKNKHDKFHKFSMESLDIDAKSDDFLSFFKKIVLMDIQSRPNKLSKYRILEIYNAIEDKKFFKNNFKKEFGIGKEKELIEKFEEELLSIKDIGPKIAYLIIKNIFYFGDTEKYFGVKRSDILPMLKLPVDIHIRNLLCYRLQICSIDLYNEIQPGKDIFQRELKELCQKSKELLPIDLEILWYIGYNNCNRRVFCSQCKVEKYCKDKNFEIETRNNMKNKSKDKQEKMKKEIEEVKNYNEPFDS